MAIPLVHTTDPPRAPPTLPSLRTLQTTRRYQMSALLNHAGPTAAPPSPHATAFPAPEEGGSEPDTSVSPDEEPQSATNQPPATMTGRPAPGKKLSRGLPTDDPVTKELLRKERKREAVRRCRKRKREAALKLEAQFKFQRRRQEVLMSELQKSAGMSESDIARGDDTEGGGSSTSQSSTDVDNGSQQPHCRQRMYEPVSQNYNDAMPQQQQRTLQQDSTHQQHKMNGQQQHPLLQTALRDQLLSAHRAHSLKHQPHQLHQQHPQDQLAQLASTIMGMPVLPEKVAQLFQQRSDYGGGGAAMANELLVTKVPATGAQDLQSPRTAMQESLTVRTGAHANNLAYGAAGAHAQQLPSLRSPQGLSSPFSHNPLASLLAVAEQQFQSIAPGDGEFQSGGGSVVEEIVAQRKEEVKEMVNSMPTAEETKEAKRRERKREAVRRCRLRKRQQHEQLQLETQKLMRQNEELQSSLLSGPM